MFIKIIFFNLFLAKLSLQFAAFEGFLCLECPFFSAFLKTFAPLSWPLNLHRLLFPSIQDHLNANDMQPDRSKKRTKFQFLQVPATPSIACFLAAFLALYHLQRATVQALLDLHRAACFHFHHLSHNISSRLLHLCLECFLEASLFCSLYRKFFRAC